MASQRLIRRISQHGGWKFAVFAVRHVDANLEKSNTAAHAASERRSARCAARTKRVTAGVDSPFFFFISQMAVTPSNVTLSRMCTWK